MKKKVIRTETVEDTNVQSAKLIEAAEPLTDGEEASVEKDNQEFDKRLVRAINKLTKAQATDWRVEENWASASISIYFDNCDDADGVYRHLHIINNNVSDEKAYGDEIICEIKRHHTETVCDNLDIGDCNQLENSICKDLMIKKWKEDSL
jgi:hypothetical protein